jgi:hypothetical protein
MAAAARKVGKKEEVLCTVKERANRPPRPRPHGITDHGTRQKVTVNCKVMSYESLIGSDWMSSCDL